MKGSFWIPWRGSLLATLLCLILGGCSGKPAWQAQTFPATGTVSINGEPPTGAILYFHSTQDNVDARKSIPWGLVQSDGTYELSTYEPGDGAPEGTYALTIMWPASNFNPKDRLGSKFMDPAQPIAEVKIVSGDNNLPPVELKDIQVLAKRSPSSKAILDHASD